jgi:hypothetical protein
MLQQSDLIPRIQLARMFPRDIDEFRLALRKEATSDPSGMVYSKPQGWYRDHRAERAHGRDRRPPVRQSPYRRAVD